jgi:hypothetical protein
MASVFKYGTMGKNMKANGNSIKLMDKVNFGMLMEISMKDNG